MTKIEEGIQRVVIEMRDLWAPQIPRLGLLFHIPNGGQRNSGEAGRLKAMGTVPGMPDLCLPVRTQKFGALYIELKKPGGKLSKAQEERIPRLREAGNDVQVCDSIEKAWANILWHLCGEQITWAPWEVSALKALKYPKLVLEDYERVRDDTGSIWRETKMDTHMFVTVLNRLQRRW